MKYFKTVVITIILFILSINSAFSQTVKFPEPRQEKLLNGLKLLIWNEPSAQKATVKIRIHYGAAFDPKDKMGTMALLADILFPNEQAKAYFTEDLEGSLDIDTTYDFIEISATGKTDELQAILETLATAVTNPQITKDFFEPVLSARIEKVKELEKNPAYVADLAVSHRLYGDFPYGKSAQGTSESLAKIDLADLLLAEQRFFKADYATLAVIGNANPDFVYRSVRRLFGGWQKSEAKIPATFRLPDAPDTKEIAIELPEVNQPATRFAVNVAPRNDKDFYATQILMKIRQNQFCLNNEASYGKSSYQPYLLRGFYMVSKYESANGNTAGCQVLTLKDGKFISSPVTQSDFDAAKSAVISEYRQRNISEVADLWFDVDTYKLSSVKDEMAKLNNVSLGDVQRVAGKLQNEPVVSIVVRKSSAAGQ